MKTQEGGSENLTVNMNLSYGESRGGGGGWRLGYWGMYTKILKTSIGTGMSSFFLKNCILKSGWHVILDYMYMYLLYLEIFM